MIEKDKTKKELIEEIQKLKELLRKYEDAGHPALYDEEKSYLLGRAMFKTSLDAVFLESLDGTIIYCNESAGDMYGYSREDLIGASVLMLVPDDVHVDLNARSEKHVQKERLFVETVAKKKDGSLFPVEISSRIVDLDNERYIVSFVHDISTIKKTTLDLQQSEEKFRHLVENIHEVIYTLDLEGFITYISPGLETLTGIPSSDLLGHHFTEIIYPDDVDFILKEYSELMEEKYKPSDYRIKKKDGTPLYIQTNSRIIKEDGVPVGITGVLTDINQLKLWEAELVERNERNEVLNQELAATNEELEAMYEEVAAANEELETANEEMADAQNRLLAAHAELEKSELRYRGLFENSPIALMEQTGKHMKTYIEKLRDAGVHDFKKYFKENPEVLRGGLKRLKVVGVNDAALDLFGAADKDTLTREIGRLVRKIPDEFLIDEMTTFAEGRGHFQGETELDTMTGESIHAIVRITIPPAFSERWERIIISILDITEQKRLEEQFRQVQKMEAVGRLAGGVAHDFNNLLMVITGNAGVLLHDPACSEKMKSRLEEIQLASDRGADLTRQLLAFSRKQVMKPVILNVNDIVRNLEKMLKRLIGENIILSSRLESGLSMVKADPSQIEQVIINLVVNARDAMPDGGNMTIVTKNVAVDHVKAADISVPAPGRYIMASVIDTGTGIDEKIQSHLFEPFFTTKDVGKGSGLGLATVYGIVQQSGGGITLKSQVGQGTRFDVYLPAEEMESAGKSETLLGVRDIRGNETVLLVEDDSMVRDMIEGVMLHFGYTVLVASHPEKAIELNAGYKKKIDLLLTDIVMPGMDGFSLASRIAESREGIKILFISGYSEDVISGSTRLNDSVYLQKPFTPQELLGKVRMLLGGSE